MFQLIFYSACVLAFVYVLWRIYCMYYDDEWQHVQKDPDVFANSSSKITEALDNKKTVQLTDANTVKQTDNYLEAIPRLIYAGLATLFSGLFSPSSRTTQSKRLEEELNDALSKCNKQINSEIQDKDSITEGLINYNQESAFFIKNSRRQELQKKSIAKQSVFFELVDKGGCGQLLIQLRELMNSYPKYLYYDTPSIDSLEKFAEERRLHHGNVLIIANLLLPELFALLNENKAIDNTWRQALTR